MATSTISLAFNAGERSANDITGLIDRAGLKATAESPGMGVFMVTMDANSAELARMREVLRDEKIEWIETRNDEYSDAEIASASLLIAEIEVEPRGHGGPTYGTEYDFSQACDLCATGASQVGNLILRSAELPKSGDVLSTLDGERLVSWPLREILEGADLDGLEIRDVVDATTGKRLDWSQLVASSSLTPMAPSTEGIERENPCPECRRDGHFTNPAEPFVIRYELTDDQVQALPAVMTTWECFGNSVIAEPFAKSHFAEPLFVVKAHVAHLLRDERIEGVGVMPVEVIGTGS